MRSAETRARRFLPSTLAQRLNFDGWFHHYKQLSVDYHAYLARIPDVHLVNFRRSEKVAILAVERDLRR